MSTPFHPIRLGVNIDHVATVRQARRGEEPDPIAAAVLAMNGGADGITVHLREDRRHIQDRDVRLLRGFVPRLNLEMSVADEIVAFACDIKPNEATLVPEKREELTTEGGLDVVSHEKAVEAAIKHLHGAGVSVALFVDPDIAQVDCAKFLGARAIEIQTARYSETKSESAIQQELDALRTTCTHALTKGLAVHLGHGLNYRNVGAVVRLPGVQELNIGHSIVSRAVLVGMERAVREMKEAMRVS
jgi:pyridoxine 5-phosphate synthase